MRELDPAPLAMVFPVSWGIGCAEAKVCGCKAACSRKGLLGSAQIGVLGFCPSGLDLSLLALEPTGDSCGHYCAAVVTGGINQGLTTLPD